MFGSTSKIIGIIAVGSFIAGVGAFTNYLSIEPANSTSKPRSEAVRHNAIDGDTTSISVRLADIDAFEADQMCRDKSGRCITCGQDAKRALKHLLALRTKTTISGYDRYGRAIGNIETEKGNLSRLMILNGYAVPYNGAYQKEHEIAQRQSHGSMNYSWISPKEWRQGKRLSCNMPAISGQL